MIMQFIKGIPNSTLESARIDGANEIRCLFSIVLPSCLPIAALISVNTYLGVWNDYSSSLIYLSNSEDKWTLALGFYKTSLNPLFRENKQMAMGIIMCIPSLIIFGISQKLLIEGVSISGMDSASLGIKGLNIKDATEAVLFFTAETSFNGFDKQPYVEGKEYKRYFLNGMGIGFDAQVCLLTDRLKRIYGGHSWVYTLSLFIALFKWKPTKMQIIYDDDAIEDDVFTIAVANGCYSGGGFKQVPADPTDGVFHTNVVPRLTPKILSTIIGYLFRGELWNHPACTMKTTKHFKIKTRESFLIETDGIMLEGHGPYTAEIIPSALNMIV